MNNLLIFCVNFFKELKYNIQTSNFKNYFPNIQYDYQDIKRCKMDMPKGTCQHFGSHFRESETMHILMVNNHALFNIFNQNIDVITNFSIFFR